MHHLTAWYTKYVKEGLLRQKPLVPSPDGRHVPLRVGHDTSLVDERRGRKFVPNTIRTSRYTIYDFLPKQLWFQLTRPANIYFLCVGIPQTVPGLSTTGSYTTILPLAFFILLTILEEGFDDYRRHRLDTLENNNIATVLGTPRTNKHDWQGWRRWRRWRRWRGSEESEVSVVDEDDEDDDKGDPDGTHQWNQVRWHEVKVGDIVRLSRDEDVPADIILLAATGEEGVAYIDTMALDGETTLKSKSALSAFKDCNSIAALRSLDNALFVVEDPNPDLYHFDGKVTVHGKTFPLTPSEVIYRGCTLRNTRHAVGIVINTGNECKIRLNANQHPKAKTPAVEKVTNRIVATLAAYVLLLTGGLSAGYAVWKREVEESLTYLMGETVGMHEIFIGFAIQFNNVVPLALYISLEIVKAAQAIMLTNDIEMYHEATDTRAKCNTNTILENLGQVSHIFSDKTGTLTENVMKFRKMSIAGTAWLHDRDSEDDTTSPPQSDLTTTDLLDYIRMRPTSPFARKARDYILSMALCHTCLPEVKDGKVDFQAASPDELALVRAARELGYLVTARSSRHITLEIDIGNGEKRTETYEVLDVIEFSSARKRMSIIVRYPDGRIAAICKGADSAIVPRLKLANVARHSLEEVRRSADEEHLMLRRSAQLEPRTSFGGRPSLNVSRSSIGLQRQAGSSRTRPGIGRSQSAGTPNMRSSDDGSRPSLGVRMISLEKFAFLNSPVTKDEAAVFTRCFKHLDEFATEGLRTLMYARKFIPEQEYQSWKRIYDEASTSLTNRQDKIEAAGELIEQSLDLVGATAIEDKLQDGVPETIEMLRQANIKIWMLTGDKRETAISIAHSARLCGPVSDIYVLDSTKGDLAGQMTRVVDEIQSGDVVHSVVVIDGQTLAKIEQDAALKEDFYALIPTIDNVICCRASPAQKAKIVQALRERVRGALTLAIGDGANDLAMITAAHVGVGISGKEGLQAARVAEFAIAQFRFLQRLLLVHGHWNYIRTAKFILATFWKEMFFYVPTAIYQRHTGLTGTSLYESTSLTVFNTLFTSLAVILPGIFEQDFDATTLLAVPELYVQGQRHAGLNIPKYFLWMVSAATQGVAVWFIVWAGFGDSKRDDSLYALGQLAFSIGVAWINVKLLFIETNHITFIIYGGFLITFIGWWVWCILLAVVYKTLGVYAISGSFLNSFGRDPMWWATFFVAVAVLVMLEAAFKTLRHLFLKHQSQ